MINIEQKLSCSFLSWKKKTLSTSSEFNKRCMIRISVWHYILTGWLTLHLKGLTTKGPICGVYAELKVGVIQKRVSVTQEGQDMLTAESNKLEAVRFCCN